MKTVANEAAKKKGETAKLPITSPTPTAPVNETATPVQMSPERDEQMYADMKTMGNKTLAESIQGFSGTNPSPPQAPVINYGGSQYLTSAPAAGAPAAG